MGLFDQIVEIVNKEYDRRIKRSSEIIEYGMHHGHGHSHGHDDHDHDDHDPGEHEPSEHESAEMGGDAEVDDDGAVVISNVAPGADVYGSGSYRPPSAEPESGQG